MEKRSWAEREEDTTWIKTKISKEKLRPGVSQNYIRLLFIVISA